MTIDLSDIDCVMFDLDGTLLGVGDDVFEGIYTKYIANYFDDVLSPDKMVQHLWKGTEIMMQHSDEERYVLESFFDYFTEATGLDREDTYDRFDRFYRGDFSKLEEVCEPMPISRQLVDKLQSMDIPLICATNPVFPEIATKQRLEWIDLSFEDFAHTTHAENSHYCKPNKAYFEQLVQLVDAIPNTTLMVGNDYLFDAAAAQIGIRTWIIDRFQGNIQKKGIFPVTYEGSLQLLFDSL